jgi:phospholipase C
MKSSLAVHFGNSGKVAAVYQVYSGDGVSGPWTYTVAPDTELSDRWSLTANGQTEYDLSGPRSECVPPCVQGQHFRKWQGESGSSLTYDRPNNGVILGIDNHGDAVFKVRVFNSYANEKTEHILKPNGEVSEFWSLHNSYGWCDFTITTDSDASFRQRLAGHLETGHASMTDPAIGSAQPGAQASVNQRATSSVTA